MSQNQPSDYAPPRRSLSERFSVHTISVLVFLTALASTAAFTIHGNMERAHRVAEGARWVSVVYPRVMNDPRFCRIDFNNSQGGDTGGIEIRGTVSTPQDFASLQALITAGGPSPVPITWKVTVQPVAPAMRDRC